MALIRNGKEPHLELKRTGFSQEDLVMARMILSYLVKNPDAKDTIHGIAQWWLLNEKIDQTLYSILNALNFLISKDLVREYNLHGDCIYYQVNKDKLDNIVDLLKAPKNGNIVPENFDAGTRKPPIQID